MNTAIVCYNCGARGKVAKVTPGLICRCGSNDLDLDEGQQVTAGRHDVNPNRQEGFDTAYNLRHLDPEDLKNEGHSEYGKGINEGIRRRQNENNLNADGYEMQSRHRVDAGRHDVHPNDQQGFDDGMSFMTTHPDERFLPRGNDPILNDPNYRRGENKASDYIDSHWDDQERQMAGSDGQHRHPDQKWAAAKGPGTGWGQPRPDPLAGWNEYAGPMPATNPLIGPNLVANPNGTKCPICKGSGYDIKDRSVCRECGGTGEYTPMTSAPSAPYVKSESPNKTKKPFVGKKKVDYSVDTFVMTASCPVDNNATTYLAKDAKGNAWWSCKCGSLANLDHNPWINPYNPPVDFRADRGLKRGKVASKSEPAKLLRTLASVQNVNAVSPREALTLTLEALKQFPER